MWEVEQTLVVGVGVDRRHPASGETECVVQHLRHGRQAVRRTRCVRDDVVLGRIVFVVVHSQDQHQVGALGGGGDDDLLGSRGQVFRRVVAAGEEPRRFEDDVDAEVAPGQRRGITLREHLERARADTDRVAVDRHGVRQVSEDRVVLQQVGEGVGAGDVVDGHELELCLIERCAQDVAPDPSESVDADPDGHGCLPPESVSASEGAQKPAETVHFSKHPCERSNQRPILRRRIIVMYALYSLALCVYFIALLPGIGYRALRHGKALGRLRDRFGRLPPDINPRHERSIWIHAVSVGEVLTAKPILTALRRAYPSHRLLLSTTTATGQAVAGQLADAVDATFYAPLDLPPFVARALDRITPDLLVVVDTELWPNLLRACRRRGVKTVVVNGRISDRSYRRYRLVRPFMRRALRPLDHVCAQSQLWGKRFVDLGVPAECLTVTGSLKFDAVSPAEATHHVGDRVLPFFTFSKERPVVIAASTLQGEERFVLRAFAHLRETHPDVLLILAPRHPERFDEVWRLVRDRQLRVVRRTDLQPGLDPSADVVVLDTLGELARLFQVGTVVFVGGSLVPAGGHNLLEPAAFGKPIVFGPHMQNFDEIARTFVAHGGAIQVASEQALASALEGLLGDPVRRASLGATARALVEANRGAQHRTLAAIAALLPGGEPRPHSDTPAIRAVQSP